MSQDEQIAIYDDQQNLLGYKRRGDLTDDDCWRTVCVWIENSKGQVLLQQRALSKQLDPGKWTCAAIETVIGQDSYDETAQRGLSEELGLAGCTLTPTNRLHTRTVFGWRWNQGYIAHCDWPIEKFKPQADEVAQLKWVDRHEAIKNIREGHPDYCVIKPTWIELFDLS